MVQTNVSRPVWEKAFHPDPARSYTLPARYCIDADVLEREKEAIFFRSWMYAGHVEDLPEAGSYITCAIFDQNIVIIRGTDGALRGFYNVCSHRAHELLEGTGRTKAIVCPYHAWSYHLDGRLRTARGSEKVAGFDGGEFCLKPVRLDEFGGFLFVNLDADATPLTEQADGLLDEIRGFAPDLDGLTKAETLVVDIAANWKVVVDNFLECYHCALAHPDFAKLVDLKTYRSKTHAIHSSHICRSGNPDNPAYAFDVGDASQVGCFWWLWPTTTFNVAPGPANLAMFYLVPTGPETTRAVTDYYFESKEISAQARARIDYANDVLQPEDTRLCESVQRGLHSRGYNQGRFIVDNERTEISEHAVHHFHALVKNALGD